MSPDQHTEYAKIMASRASFYRLMASIYFKEVTEDFISRASRLSEIGFEKGSLLEEGASEIKHYLMRSGPDPRTDLAVDYARVFLSAGTYEGKRANPYESIYTSKEGLIMQDARDDVLAIYVQNGVTVDQSLNLPEDHLSFELEFMAIMSERAQALIAQSDAAALLATLHIQRRFATDHLANWLPVLQNRIEDCAKLRFYPAIAKMTLGYVREDIALLDELVALVKG